MKTMREDFVEAMQDADLIGSSWEAYLPMPQQHLVEGQKHEFKTCRCPMMVWVLRHIDHDEFDHYVDDRNMVHGEIVAHVLGVKTTDVASYITEYDDRYKDVVHSIFKRGWGTAEAAWNANCVEAARVLAVRCFDRHFAGVAELPAPAVR